MTDPEPMIPIPPNLSALVYPWAWGADGPLKNFFAPPNEGYIVPGGSSGELGWHSISTALICPRKAWYKMQYGAEFLEDESRESPDWKILGTAVHAGLAQHYECLRHYHEIGYNIYFNPVTASPGYAVLKSVYEEVFVPQGFLSAEAWESKARIAMTILEAYLRYWEAETRNLMAPASGYFVRSVEKTLHVKRPRLPARTQRVDVEIQTPYGVIFGDHKITQKAANRAIHVFSTDGQFDGYHEIGKATYGNGFFTSEVNVLHYTVLPTGKVRVGFARSHVPYRAQWDETITRGLKIIADIRKRIREKRNGPAGISSYPVCHDWHDPCPFVTVCRANGLEVSI